MRFLTRLSILLCLSAGIAFAADRTAQNIGSVDRYTITSFPLYGSVVTPSDTVDLTQPGFIRANGAGDAKVICFASSSSVTLTLAAGETVPCLVRRVYATGTTVVTLHEFY